METTLNKDIKNYVSFCVDDVQQKNTKLNNQQIEKSILDGVGKKKPEKQVDMSLIYSPPTDPYIFIGASSNKSVLTHSYRGKCHAVLQAVNDSFNNHLPLVFSPDIIYQTILQGVSQHINLYPEQYRKFLVSHEKKKDLIIFRPDLSLNDVKNISNNLSSIVSDFRNIMKQNISESHFDIFQNKFSTTTENEETAAQITCMEAFSPYFGYMMVCGCGFPEIRLEGNREDWIKLGSLINKIEELFYIDTEVNLTWWTEKLKKITNHFILASEGKPVIDWWKSMYKQMNRYMSHFFNGWIGWLYPYSKTKEVWNKDISRWEKPAQEWQKNPMLENISNEIVIKDYKDVGVSMFLGAGKTEPTGIENFTFSDENQRNVEIYSFSKSYDGSCFMSTCDFPLGLSKVDLKISDISMQKTIDTILIGGFLGVSQDENDGALKPLIGYAMVK